MLPSAQALKRRQKELDGLVEGTSHCSIFAPDRRLWQREHSEIADRVLELDKHYLPTRRPGRNTSKARLLAGQKAAAKKKLHFPQITCSSD